MDSFAASPGQFTSICPTQRTCRLSRLHAVGGSQRFWGRNNAGAYAPPDSRPAGSQRPWGSDMVGTWQDGSSAWSSQAALAEPAGALRARESVAMAAWEAQAEAQAVQQRSTAQCVRETLARGAALEAAEAAAARLSSSSRPAWGGRGGVGWGGGDDAGRLLEQARGAAWEAAEAAAARTPGPGRAWEGRSGAVPPQQPARLAAWEAAAAGAAQLSGSRQGEAGPPLTPAREGEERGSVLRPRTRSGVGRCVEGWAAAPSEEEEKQVAALQVWLTPWPAHSQMRT